MLQKLLSTKEVWDALTGFARSTLYEEMSKGRFPKPIKARLWLERLAFRGGRGMACAAHRRTRQPWRPKEARPWQAAQEQSMAEAGRVAA